MNLRSRGSAAQAVVRSPPTPHPHHRRPCTFRAHRRRQVVPTATAHAPPVPKGNSPLSRRVVTAGGALLLPLLLGKSFSQASPPRAADDVAPDGNQSSGQEEPALGAGCASSETPTMKAFLDVSIDGEPAGRIVVGLYGVGAPVGAARFASLVTGAAGVSYRRKEFIKVSPSYIRHGGVRAYGVGAETEKKTAGSGFLAANGDLVSEWEEASKGCRGSTKSVAGVLGLVVRDPSKPPPKLKLVARNGKLEIDQEEVGADPNGTEFVITTRDSPELDASTLVIGRALEGMEVVERISNVKAVRENTGSPYFRVAKLIGDKRAVVAERGFNRPYSKVIVTNCGLIE